VTLAPDTVYQTIRIKYGALRVRRYRAAGISGRSLRKEPQLKSRMRPEIPGTRVSIM
jgi:hypothetical protein